MLTPTGPVPKWATAKKKDNLTRPSAKLFGQFVNGARDAATASQVDMWSIWNEPNQPQFLLPQYRKGKPYSPTLYRGLYQRGLQRDPQRAGEPQGQDPDRRDVAARQRPHRAPAALPARDRCA